MSKRFDATLNALIDLRAGQWADCFSRIVEMPSGPSSPVDTDLATTVQADRVFHIAAPRPYLLHLELEANPRTGIPRELHRYNTLLDHQHNLPVETVLVLLRPKALASDLDLEYRRLGATGRKIATFHYHIERVWERPAGFWLDGGVGLAPLALLTDEADRDLDGTLARFQERLEAEGTDETTIRSLIGSSFVLCGLRYNDERVAETYRRFSMLLEDSTTYQAILQKGVKQGLTQGLSQGERIVLLRQGTKRFGPPSEDTLAAFQAIVDPDRLERLADRIHEVGSWNELIAVE